MQVASGPDPRVTMRQRPRRKEETLQLWTKAGDRRSTREWLPPGPAWHRSPLRPRVSCLLAQQGLRTVGRT